MFRNLFMPVLTSVAVTLAACGGSDRHAQSPSADATGGAGPGVTSGSPAEPDSFADPEAKPPSSRNPARRRSRQTEEDLLALRSSLFSQPIERARPSQASGGSAGMAGSGGVAPVASGGTASGGAASGGIINRGGPSRGGRPMSGGALSAD